MAIVPKIPEIKLIQDSIYEITSLKSKDAPMVTRGRFKGYTNLGSLSALCIELDPKYHKDLGKKIRMIPSHVVMTIDIIQVATEEKSEEQALRTYVS